MAFAAATIWEVQAAGLDANGGGFDPSNANMATDLAATSATGSSPVVSSASYTFVAGDVGHWLFVKSGTNWTPGWYSIASVSGGSATLSAAVGAANLLTGNLPVGMSTAAGCATTASPTGGTWSIDYSRSTAPYSYSDMVIDGTTNTKFTSAAHPVGVNLVGNNIQVWGGTGFTLQIVQVVSVSGTTATCDKSLGTLGSTGGQGTLGGPLGSPGKMAGFKIGSNPVFIKNAGGATPDTFSLSSTSNAAGGRVTDATSGSQTAPNFWVGYETSRHVKCEDTNRPILKANANSVTCFTGTGSYVCVHNIDFGNNGAFTGVNGVSLTGNFQRCYRSKATSCTGTGYTGSSATTAFIAVVCDTCGAGITPGSSHIYGFVIKSCTGAAINAAGVGAVISRGLIINNGSNSVSLGSNGINVLNVTVYNSSGHGFVFNSGTANNRLINCVSYLTAAASSGKNFNDASATAAHTHLVLNCAGGAGDAADALATGSNVNFITLTADPFVDAAGGDFGLNNTAGGGAALKAAGYDPSFLWSGNTHDAPAVGVFQYSTAGSSGGGLMLPIGFTGGYSA